MKRFMRAKGCEGYSKVDRENMKVGRTRTEGVLINHGVGKRTKCSRLSLKFNSYGLMVTSFVYIQGGKKKGSKEKAYNILREEQKVSHERPFWRKINFSREFVNNKSLFYIERIDRRVRVD